MTSDFARFAYECYAPIYDLVNAESDYELWLGEALLPELEKHGLSKGWALDIGCGTGRAFPPLLKRGWKVVGCDLSPAMLSKAKQKFGSQVPLFCANARQLPRSWPIANPAQGFDLILLLNDVLNYLTEEDALEELFVGVARNLNRDGGLVVFDANTLAMFREAFASGVAPVMEQRGLHWRGMSEQACIGGTHEAEVAAPGIEPHVHRQRHWTIAQIVDALAVCDLNCLAILGQHEEGRRVLLSDSYDQDVHHKLIFIAGRS